MSGVAIGVAIGVARGLPSKPTTEAEQMRVRKKESGHGAESPGAADPADPASGRDIPRGTDEHADDRPTRPEKRAPTRERDTQSGERESAGDADR